MPSCVGCGASYEGPVYRSTLCNSCGKELKTCRNCMHFVPDNGCREPMSEMVLDRDRANFCDWFKAASSAGSNKKDERKNEILRQSLSKLLGDQSDDA